ncbi:MAG: ATP-binding protein, partial [Dehalococcoidia bacterium]
KLEAVGRLAGGIAHDFNNLLTVVMGYCQLSMWEAPPESELETHLQEVQKSAERAANLTNQLLAFSRRQVIEPKVISLNNLIIGLDRMLRRLIGEDIELITLPSADLSPVKVDPGQLEQVLMNLVINARDAMPEGGKLIVQTSDVTIDARQASVYSGISPGRYVMLQVTDTGVGMSEAVKAHIFEPFFTTKSVGRGTGLGLATCYGIVCQSGGHIEVHSEPGDGTTFQVFIPASQESVYAVAEDKEPVDVSGGTETVLLAEDDPMVRTMVTTILSDQGYHVLAAANGDEALRIASECAGTKIHLLLTDMVMPQMGGMELASKLKELYPETKIIFTSGYTEEPMFQQGYLDPGIEFIQKPYVPAVLGRKVRDVLDQPVV